MNNKNMLEQIKTKVCKNCDNVLLKRNKTGYCVKCYRTFTRSIHGMSRTRFYKLWCDINYRCSWKATGNNKKNYYSKGICVEWKDFESFMNDMYKLYLELSEKIWEENVSIERIDNDKNYCKENCKRIHIKEQSKNKSNNVYYSYNGITDTLAGWSRRLNIQSSTLRRRIMSGRSIERTFTTIT